MTTTNEQQQQDTATAKTEPPPGPMVAIALALPVAVLRDILITALECGSGYWARVDMHAEEVCDALLGGPARAGVVDVWELVDRMYEGDEPQRHTLTARDLSAAWAKLPPRRLGNLLGGNWDAEDADIFFQCAVLGEVRYG